MSIATPILRPVRRNVFWRPKIFTYGAQGVSTVGLGDQIYTKASQQTTTEIVTGGVLYIDSTSTNQPWVYLTPPSAGNAQSARAQDLIWRAGSAYSADTVQTLNLSQLYLREQNSTIYLREFSAGNVYGTLWGFEADETESKDFYNSYSFQDYWPCRQYASNGLNATTTTVPGDQWIANTGSTDLVVERIYLSQYGATSANTAEIYLSPSGGSVVDAQAQNLIARTTMDQYDTYELNFAGGGLALEANAAIYVKTANANHVGGFVVVWERD